MAQEYNIEPVRDDQRLVSCQPVQQNMPVRTRVAWHHDPVDVEKVQGADW